MNCNESQNYIMRYFDKDLNDIEQAKLKQHLKNCEQCSEEFSNMQQIFTEIEQDTEFPEPPEDFELQVMNRIEKEAYMYQKQKDDNVFVYNILLVAVSLIFVIVFGSILWEALNKPIGLIQQTHLAFETVKDFLSATVSMIKGLTIAVVGVTASIYKTYYYAYLILGILLLVTQGLFIRMVKAGNGGAR
ncbi:anti-sigma factor family protein [Ruminiclostridium josui]|uniref:anti-sigma factor family protein n=1 Tax=Ruminiclostridium josui TaxID=1499 RepID=UPI000462E822|nr:zf-HC2 domain-containing protein [Ruminiclostridium josui]